MAKSISNIIPVFLSGLLTVAVLGACSETTGHDASYREAAVKSIDLTELDAVPAENRIAAIVYVPAYSSIYQQDGDRLCDLTVTLSVHNINFDQPITLKKGWSRIGMGTKQTYGVINRVIGYSKMFDTHIVNEFGRGILEFSSTEHPAEH